jgi:TldD protein
MTTSSIRRAALSPDLIPLRESLVSLFSILEPKTKSASDPQWYSSIYFERKSSKSFSANLKQTQLADHVTSGVVLRIYDGYTLYEQATDDLDPQSLKKFATEFVQRVQSTPPPEGAKRRSYHAPTWKDRLSAKGLESELLEQIPSNPTARTPVHFGVRIEKDPLTVSAAQTLDQLKTWVEQCRKLAPKAGLSDEDLTFIAARQNFAIEESIFIDRETLMSQTLTRLALTLITMSESNRTYLRVGGLGGLETIGVKDSDIEELLKDLKALKNAERLQPGKYRVLFSPVLTGVLAHEAFGHSQEGDTCARGRSKAWELHKSGEKVGNELATILNNPAIYQTGGKTHAAWGSYFFDEEGWLAQEQVLLDRGVLHAPMTNLTSAIRLGVPRTANGKRESWANGVYTRQTNTYFSPGDRTLDQLMSDLGDGFLATHAAGGMEDPKGMGIQVGIAFLQEVKGGKLTGRVFKGPAGGDIQLTGYTPDVLNSIVAKSKIDYKSSTPDTAKHPWNDAGGCGKYHKEIVFAGCGGPYMLLDQVILG